MEYRFNQELEERNHFVFLLCVMLCAAGALTGTAVFSKSFSDVDIDAYISAQHVLPQGFGELFLCLLKSEILLLFLICLLGLFSFGWLLLPPVLIYSGLGAGTGVCCLYSRFGLFGLLYAVPVIIIPFLCTVISRSIAGREAICLSCSLMRSMSGRVSGRGRLLKVIIKVPLCMGIDIFSCALSAVMRTILFRCIS